MTVEDTLVDAVLDQHARMRELVRAVAHAGPEEREVALDRLLRFVAVHAAAERVAFSPPGDEPASDVAGADRDLLQAVERVDDLGTDSRSFTVQLGLVAAALVRHSRAGEEEALPRFAATHDEFDLRRATAALGAVDPLVGDVGSAAAVPHGAGFGHQLRAARAAVLDGLRLAGPRSLGTGSRSR
jgi:hemerythrin HHE cation binding domain-containing protein